jgi:hypothetical protein
LQELLITWGVALALLAAALFTLWPLVCRLRERRAMDRRITALGAEQLRQVLLEDGMGGLSYYERLLLTPRGILVLMGIPRDGIIFAGERMDTWAQVVGKRTIRFANPLYTLEGLLSTLRYHLPKITLEGYVLFCGDSSFPKGQPAGVWLLDDLAAVGQEGAQQAIQPVLKEAWTTLKERSRKLDPASEGYLLPVGQRPAYLRWGTGLLLVVATFGWLLWRLL